MARRVLVVDDVDEILVLVRRVLSNSGYDVDVASTLAAAQALNPLDYDAVLVDARLGSERGTDLVDELRLEDPTVVGRCLVMTGGSLSALPEGVASLAKPFQAAQLLQAVRELYRKTPVEARSQPDDPYSDLAAMLCTPARPATGEGYRAGRLLSTFRRRRKHDWQELADFLHDGPIQELIAAALDLQLLHRPAGTAPDPHVEAMQARLAGAANSLRWLVDGPWPWLPDGTELVSSLERRTAWLLAAPAAVVAEFSPLAPPDLADILLITDVLELMLIEMALTDLTALTTVAARVAADLILIEVTVRPAAGQELGNAPACGNALRELAESLQASVLDELTERQWLVRFGLPR